MNPTNKLTERERRHILVYLSDFTFTEDSVSTDWREELTDDELVNFLSDPYIGYYGGYEQFKIDYSNYE